MMKKLMTLFLWAGLALAGAAVATDKPNDADALKGVTEGKVVFDINIAEPKKLPLYLMVVDETVDDLKRQGVKPEVILAFRGKAVTLITKEREQIELTDFEYLDKANEFIKTLQSKGVKMEACSVATRLFNVDNGEILDGIKPVGNTFVSLIGYQAQGYSTIPLY
jgi:predicted peroxiredoxin